MERRAGASPGHSTGLRHQLQGLAQRQLRPPVRGHHLLRLVHHHQLYDRHQHVHRHHLGELQPGPPGGGDWHRGRGPGDVLH